MSLLTCRVEEKISAMLPHKFAVVFDGCTANQTHFVALFATSPSESQCGYDRILLGFSPFENEDSLSANAHVSYISYVLGLYERSLSNVFCFIGDNCSTNLCFADKVPGKFVGSSSHRFNLVLKDIFKESDAFIEKVHSIMKVLRRPIVAAKLRRMTHLSSALHTVTRWSSTAFMLLRYKELRGYMSDLEIDECCSGLSRREESRVNKLCEMYRQLDAVTKELQKDTTTCADVRALFDTVMLEFPISRERLSDAAERIVHNPKFERSLVKIQNGAAINLELTKQRRFKV